MSVKIQEETFAQAVQLAAGFLASGCRETTPGEEMREAVKRAYWALDEARDDLLEELQRRSRLEQ